MVYPSGRARATAAAPSDAPPPPIFSTTTVPSKGFMRSAQGRPSASKAPPGGKGITSRIIASDMLAPKRSQIQLSARQKRLQVEIRGAGLSYGSQTNLENIIRSGATVADAFLRIITHYQDGTGEAARATLPANVLDDRRADSEQFRSDPRTSGVKDSLRLLSRRSLFRVALGSSRFDLALGILVSISKIDEKRRS